jgi:aminotransferase
LRIGAVMASNSEHYEKLILSSLHNSTVHGANTVSQVAAVAALEKAGYWLDSFLNHLGAMKTLCVNELNSIPGFMCAPPDGCYVAFADITATGLTSKEMADMLLAEAKVSVVPGLRQWFGDGAEGYIRISFATSEEVLSTALSRVKKVMKNFIEK